MRSLYPLAALVALSMAGARIVVADDDEPAPKPKATPSVPRELTHDDKERIRQAEIKRSRKAARLARGMTREPLPDQAGSEGE